MIRQTNYVRITRDQYLEAPPWMERIVSPLNTWNEQVNRELQQLQFGSNIVGTIYPTTITTSATYTSGDFNPINIPWRYPFRVNGIMLIKCQDTNSPSSILLTPIGPPQWRQQTANNVQITYLAGLANSNKYDVTFLIV